MTRPKTRPSRQTSRPHVRSRCPVMAPLRKETEPRSGRTRLASLWAWTGWPAIADSCGAMAGLAEGLDTAGTLCAWAAATQRRSIARTSTRIVHDFITKTSERVFSGEIAPQTLSTARFGRRIVAEERRRPAGRPAGVHACGGETVT